MIQERLSALSIQYETDVEASSLTTIGTGGTVDILAHPRGVHELQALFQAAAAEGLPIATAGRMSNTLVSDGGIRGILVSMDAYKGIVIKGDLLIAAAGESLDDVINKAIGHNLSGLEELGGIPGTIGGATICNAGANGRELSDHFFYADYITKDGRIHRMPSYSDAFSYRRSPFSKDDIILSTAFRLKTNRNTAEARERKERYRAQRLEKGQYKYPSAGCFFKNPPLLSAGKLIDECGLKGFERKGAMVSPYHANFIVNAGGATSTSLWELGELVREAVAKRFNIALEYEIKFLGDFN